MRIANIGNSAWTVKGRDAFRSDNQSASLGKKAFGFTWAAMACLFLSTILFCLAGTSSNRGNYDANYGYRTGGKGGLFSRNRKSVRSTTSSRRSGVNRGSFIDSERGVVGSRIKDDYS